MVAQRTRNREARLEFQPGEARSTVDLRSAYPLAMGGIVDGVARLTAHALALGLLLGTLPCSTAAEAAPPAPRSESPTRAERLGTHLLEAPRLFDLPARRRLELYGIAVQLFYNQYLGWKPRGGADTDDTTGSSGSFDFFTLIDADELVGWPGLDALLHVKGQYDDNINGDVGALSDPIDDADFDQGIYVDELWLEQAFFGNRLRTRAGFLETQTLYDRNAYANSEDKQFSTTFLDNNPLVPLPNGLGATTIVTPVPWLDLAVGVADADNEPRSAGFDTAFDSFESLDLYLEATARLELPGSERPLSGAVRLGFFRDGRRRVVYGKTDSSGEPATKRGHFGAYVSADQSVYHEPSGGDQGLGVFGRFGYLDGDTSPVEWFWSLGAQYLGPIPGRDRDVIALGVYQAIGSERFQDRVDSSFDGEAGVEVYYRVAVLPWLAVTPDFQYVVDPGGFDGAKDAVVFVLRVRASF
jgi:porin